MWSLGWSYIQNKTTLIDNLASKSMIFETSPNIEKLCHFEVFLTTSKNLGSLPLKSSLISLDQALKF